MDIIAAITTVTNVSALLALWMFYHIARGLYNISPLHPLNHVPGPKLAAMSLLYEFWYDMVLGGTYTQQIKVMHQTYGEIIFLQHKSNGLSRH